MWWWVAKLRNRARRLVKLGGNWPPKSELHQRSMQLDARRAKISQIAESMLSSDMREFEAQRTLWWIAKLKVVKETVKLSRCRIWAKERKGARCMVGMPSPPQVWVSDAVGRNIR